MKPLRVISIQRGCVYDGPGVRTTVFLKGCILHCPWCCNPEAISFKEEIYFSRDKCLKTRNSLSPICKDCEQYNGKRIVEKCPFGYGQYTSTDLTVEEIFEKCVLDKSLYDRSNGGVTFSGGEPLCYSSELQPLLSDLKNNDISVYFETTLFYPLKKWEFILPSTSGMIIDLKLQPEMKMSKYYFETIKTNILKIKEYGLSIIYRIVFIDSLYEQSAIIISEMNSLDVNQIEILKCHNLAEKKYANLNMKFQSFHVDTDKLNAFLNLLNLNNISYKVLEI